MKRITLICIALFAFFSNSSAQEEIEVKNWYLEVGAGTQLLFSSDASDLDFQERLTPSLSQTAGKWFNPFWGLRLQANGYALNGLSTPEGLFIADPLNNGQVFGQNDPVRDKVTIRPDGSYRHYLRYLNAHVDFQVSLMNLIKGCEPNRKWDIIPAVGLGYFGTFKYKGSPAVNSISSNFSLMGKWNVWNNLDVNLEVATAVLPGSFDGRITDRLYENNLSLTLGVTYNFTTTKSKPSPVSVKVVEFVKDTVYINKEIEKIRIQEKAIKPIVLATVLFEFAESTPINDHAIEYVNIAKFLADNPDARIRIEGYGDKETGTLESNLEISKKRAKAVKDILIETYQVNPAQIETQAFGANEQPYEKEIWNRAVIVKGLL